VLAAGAAPRVPVGEPARDHPSGRLGSDEAAAVRELDGELVLVARAGAVLARADDARLRVLEGEGESDLDAFVAGAAAFDLPVGALVDAAGLLLDLLAVEAPLDRVGRCCSCRGGSRRRGG